MRLTFWYTFGVSFLSQALGLSPEDIEVPISIHKLTFTSGRFLLFLAKINLKLKRLLFLYIPRTGQKERKNTLGTSSTHRLSQPSSQEFCFKTKAEEADTTLTPPPSCYTPSLWASSWLSAWWSRQDVTLRTSASRYALPWVTSLVAWLSLKSATWTSSLGSPTQNPRWTNCVSGNRLQFKRGPMR